MDTHLVGTRESESSPPDSVDPKQALDGSQHNSLSLLPPMQTLDELYHSSTVPSESNLDDDSSNSDHPSPCREGALDDSSNSDSALFLDADSQEYEEKNELHSSPVNTIPAYSTSHWSSSGWDSRGGPKASASGWADWPSAGGTRPATSGWSETGPSGSEGKPSGSSWSEPLRLGEETETETETKPLVSVSPDWFSEIKPAIVGAGLANLGNTCFLNAILQCFTHTVLLLQGLRSYNHPKPCDLDREGFCVLCAFINHIEHSLASIGGVVFPWKLVDNLSYISSNFQRYQQEDAHEFLQCLLDRLDSCCIYSKIKYMTLPSVDENLVKRVFGGRLISKLQCCNCGHCSDTYEPLIDLSLEIEYVNTLPNALESFTKVEKIEDAETRFTCEQCKERVSVEKQLLLDQAPSVAALHLKRFKNDGSYVEKIDKYVEFPLELDLLPYTGGSQNNNVELKYDLYAVVVHIGFSSTSGHYYCFVRSAPDAWYRMDDSKVTRVQEDYVLSQEAYILFYAKQGTPWFSSFMEADKSSLDRNMSSNSPKSVLDNLDHLSMSSPNVANICSSTVSEAREEAVGISTESINGSRCDSVEANEAKDDFHRLYTPMSQGMSNSSSGMSCKVEKKFSPSILRENNLNQEFREVKNSANITPSSPPRSPSPDIYAEDSPVATYSIPRVPQTSEKQVPCKRPLDKDLEDSERRQARKLLKGMPKGRGSTLLAAMNRSHGDGSPNSKRNRRNESSSNRNNRNSSTRHKPNMSSFTRPVAAGSLR